MLTAKYPKQKIFNNNKLLYPSRKPILDFLGKMKLSKDDFDELSIANQKQIRDVVINALDTIKRIEQSADILVMYSQDKKAVNKWIKDKSKEIMDEAKTKVEKIMNGLVESQRVTALNKFKKAADKVKTKKDANKLVKVLEASKKRITELQAVIDTLNAKTFG